MYAEGEKREVGSRAGSRLLIRGKSATGDSRDRELDGVARQVWSTRICFSCRGSGGNAPRCRSRQRELSSTRFFGEGLSWPNQFACASEQVERTQGEVRAGPISMRERGRCDREG